MDIYRKLLERGTEIYLSPGDEYSSQEIVLGVNVNNGYKVTTMYAIDKNTYRGFHRNDKSLDGPRKLIQDYLSYRLPGIINVLLTIRYKENFEYLSDKITEELREQLGKNVKDYMLKSYNKVRKPIDLLLEHLIAMSSELHVSRGVLVPMLNVPIDSYILNSEIIFDRSAKMDLGIKHGMTYQDIQSKTQYNEIQIYIREKADSLSSLFSNNFYPIYFDLIWSNRVEKAGNNLFKTNP